MDTQRTRQRRERMWKLVSTASGVVGGVIAQRLLRKGFETVRGDAEAPSPFDPSSAQFSWPDAVVWALAAGIGLGVAKVVSNRVAALSWEAVTGTLPPGAEEPAVSH